MSAQPLEPRELPRLRDISPTRWTDGQWGPVVRVPENNVVGPFRILRRVDGLFVAYDTRLRFGSTHAIFQSEEDAREWAADEPFR